MFSFFKKKAQKQQQLQIQEQISAYNWKSVHDVFLMTIEFLEKYIEIAGYYPDWHLRKQVHDNNIQRQDNNSEQAKKSLSTMLFLFKAILSNNAPLFHDKLKQEFYQWIDSTGIDSDSCPYCLKQVLFGISEILEGKGEKILEDNKNAKKDYDVNSPQYAEALSRTFVCVQSPLQKEVETEQSLRGLSHKDLKIENRFASGDVGRGEEVFKRIKETISAYDYQENFYYFPQREDGEKKRKRGVEQEVTTIIKDSRRRVKNLQRYFPSLRENRRAVIENIRKYKNEWKIKEIITYYGFVERDKKLTLVHRSAAKEEDWRYDSGFFLLVHGKMHYEEEFNDEEWKEIEDILGVFPRIDRKKAVGRKNSDNLHNQSVETSNRDWLDKSYQGVTGHLTENGEAIINNELYERIPTDETVQVTQKQHDVISHCRQKLNQSNSKAQIWVAVGLVGELFVLVTSLRLFVFKRSLR